MPNCSTGHIAGHFEVKNEQPVGWSLIALGLWFLPIGMLHVQFGRVYRGISYCPGPLVPLLQPLGRLRRAFHSSLRTRHSSCESLLCFQVSRQGWPIRLPRTGTEAAAL